MRPHSDVFRNGEGASRLGVLLMSFGTAATLDDVPDYLSRVRGGSPPPDDLVAEFRRRFQLVGGSPLTRITREQASALEAALNGDPGDTCVVGVGMRHAPPFIHEGLAELVARGARRILCIVLSPQYSAVIMGGYVRAVDAARTNLPAELEIAIAGAWHEVPAFVDALAERVRVAIKRFAEAGRANVPVIFTAHSLPRSVADGEPGYIAQLHDTAKCVADRAGLHPNHWQFAYQSAGHTREEWLKPDLLDVLPGLRAAGHDAVVVAPVQFVADHLEVLYDVDVAAREQAAAAGLELRRTESLNASPAFIAALAEVVRRELTT